MATDPEIRAVLSEERQRGRRGKASHVTGSQRQAVLDLDEALRRALARDPEIVERLLVRIVSEAIDQGKPFRAVEFLFERLHGKAKATVRVEDLTSAPTEALIDAVSALSD